MRRKMLCWISCFILLLVTACSSQGSGGTQAQSGTNTEKPASTNASPQPSSDKKPDKYQLGVVFPLSGNAAEHGKDMLDGLQYAVKEVNANGGINGVPVELVVEDGKAVPKDSVNATQKLITVDKVPVIFTGFSSPVLASVPIADQHKVLLVNSAAATPRLANAGTFLLNTLVLQNIELNYIAQHATKELGLKKMAIIYQNNDLGLGSKEALTQYMKDNGGQLVADENFEVGAVDFRTQLSKIRSANPDALYLATAGKDTALIIKQARELGIKAQFFGYHALEMPPEYMKLAGAHANGAIYSDSAAKYDEAFSSKWAQDHNGKQIVFTNAMYYDSAKMVFEGMKAADSKGYGITGEGIRKAIVEIGTFNGIAGKTKIPENGNAIKDVAIKTIKDGKFEIIKVIAP